MYFRRNCPSLDNGQMVKSVGFTLRFRQFDGTQTASYSSKSEATQAWYRFCFRALTFKRLHFLDSSGLDDTILIEYLKPLYFQLDPQDIVRHQTYTLVLVVLYQLVAHFRLTTLTVSEFSIHIGCQAKNIFRQIEQTYRILFLHQFFFVKIIFSFLALPVKCSELSFAGLHSFCIGLLSRDRYPHLIQLVVWLGLVFRNVLVSIHFYLLNRSCHQPLQMSPTTRTRFYQVETIPEGIRLDPI